MKIRFLKTVSCLGVAALLSLHTTPAEAIFASVKSTGMAAACISYPIDTLAGAYNPAGMTDVGNRLDVEAGWVYDHGHAEVKGNLVPALNQTYSGMQMKNIAPFSFGLNKVWQVACDWQVSAGVILYNRNYQKTTYNKVLPLLGTTEPGLEYLNETISPIIAVKWCDSHSIGISANYQLERLKVNGLQNFQGISIAPHDVTNRGYDYASGWGFTVGYHGQITNELAIGLTYQPKTSMSRMDKYKGFLAGHGMLDVPRKISGGISYRFIPCFIVAFDVEQLQWSDIRAFHNPLLHNDHIAPLGSDHGPGFGFRDQWFYRLGAEWTINEDWTIRLGYRFSDTPVKQTQTAVNILSLDTVESFITTGATWNVTENNELSFFFAYGFEHTVKGKDAIPLAGFGGGNVDLTEQKLALGLSWGFKF